MKVGKVYCEQNLGLEHCRLKSPCMKKSCHENFMHENFIFMHENEISMHENEISMHENEISMHENKIYMHEINIRVSWRKRMECLLNDHCGPLFTRRGGGGIQSQWQIYSTRYLANWPISKMAAQRGRGRSWNTEALLVLREGGGGSGQV